MIKIKKPPNGLNINLYKIMLTPTLLHTSKYSYVYPGSREDRSLATLEKTMGFMGQK